MNYTDIIDGYQIRDVTFIGLPPKDTSPRYDIVKHVDCEPYEAINLVTGKRQTYTHYVYTEARKCPVRHMIDSALPHEVNTRDGEHCRYSDMAIGLIEEGSA